MASIVNYRNAFLLNRSQKCLITWKFRDFTRSTQCLSLQSRPLTSQTTVNGSNNQKKDKTPFNKLDLTFSDTKEAYQSKTTAELFRAIFILQISQFKFLVHNHEKVIII